MEKEQTVQLPTIESDKEQTNSFGKFKSAEELLKAYNSLEGEFTKRSQRLKELEAKKEDTQTWETKVEEFVKEYPITNEYVDEVIEVIKEEDSIGKNNGLEKALLKVLSGKVKTVDQMVNDSEVIKKAVNVSQIRDSVIEDYLSKIQNDKVPMPMPSVGATPLASVSRPKSIGEAGELAKKIFNN